MKRYAVIFTPRAERQLNNLYTYIADHSNEARAHGFVEALVAECVSLSNFPERGTKRGDIRPNLRTMGFAKRMAIAFSVHATTDTVAIHGVFYGGQDFEQMLRGEK